MEGQRQFQVRGFCESYYSSEDPTWERIPVMLLDAGRCTFEVEFDAVTGELLVLEWGTPGP